MNSIDCRNENELLVGELPTGAFRNSRFARRGNWGPLPTATSTMGRTHFTWLEEEGVPDPTDQHSRGVARVRAQWIQSRRGTLAPMRCLKLLAISPSALRPSETFRKIPRSLSFRNSSDQNMDILHVFEKLRPFQA